VKTVFFDVDTQMDFLYPSGALYVPGAEEIVPTLGNLTRFAAERKIPIVSTMDAHAEDDPEFQVWKPHCVAGAFGQQKATATRLPNAAVLDSKLHVSAPQMIVEKQVLDPFSNPNLRPLLDKLATDRYVLYGVVTEICVRCAANGLLETGARIDLVTDAVKSLNGAEEESFLAEFQSLGGKLISSAEVLSE
jgi:nicotinamidase/pyrazinamidase